VDPGVPDTVHCAPAASWDPLWSQYEDEVLIYVNDARARGYDCDSEGVFGSAPPLVMESRLRCAARLHSRYMAETGDFNHTTAGGSTPWDRIEATGYQFWTAGENIAAGQQDPQGVVTGWLESDGHCSNIMSPEFDEIGIGYYPSEQSSGWGNQSYPYWTQVFATPL